MGCVALLINRQIILCTLPLHLVLCGVSSGRWLASMAPALAAGWQGGLLSSTDVHADDSCTMRSVLTPNTGCKSKSAYMLAWLVMVHLAV